MSRIRINGLRPLRGRISIQGSKNAALPMMAAALLHKGVTVLTNVPVIQDVECMAGILEYIGCRLNRKGGAIEIDASFPRIVKIPDSYVRRMRSSVILLGAMAGRLGEGESGYPGGCLIGARPIDMHLQVLRELGARVEEREESVRVRPGAGGLKGARIVLRYPSVGATEQALLAAVLAEGVTVIENAAREPEVSQLCLCLRGMGARVFGIGTGTLAVYGVKELHDSCFSVRGDRIVAGTYLAAVMAARGEVCLRGLHPGELALPLRLLRQAGARVREDEAAGEVSISMDESPGGLQIETGPYPAFPTDLQPPFMAFLAAGRGESRLSERVFEARFGAAEELNRMGARIRLEGGTALVQGAGTLQGARVWAKDLRGGAALAVAALAARGETVIEGCGHIERGYEDLCRDLRALGAEAFWERGDV